MARHAKRLWDEERTALLGQRELFVEKGKGGPDYFLAWLQAPEVDACPLCASKVIKIQDLFSKTYYDFVQSDDDYMVISLEYDFHKFRCLNERAIIFLRRRSTSRPDAITLHIVWKTKSPSWL